MRTVFVMAHADDEVIGCGELIQQSYNPLVAFTCTERNKKRIEEAYAAAKVLGYDIEWLDCFEDNHSSQADFNYMVQRIEKVVADAGLVVTHHIADLYPDHSLTAKATLNASRMVQRVLMCQPIWFGERPVVPHITMHTNRLPVAEALACYESQNQNLCDRETYEVVRWSI